MQAQTSPAAQPTTEPAAACYVCDATDDLRVAYRYWTDNGVRPVKWTKWICNDGRRCCRRIDAKYAAVARERAA